MLIALKVDKTLSLKFKEIIKKPKMQFYIFVLNLTFASWETRKGIHTCIKRTFVFSLKQLIEPLSYKLCIFTGTPTRKKKRAASIIHNYEHILRQGNCKNSFILIVTWSEMCYGVLISMEIRKIKCWIEIVLKSLLKSM